MERVSLLWNLDVSFCFMKELNNFMLTKKYEKFGHRAERRTN
jgi:hypothetical protein